MHPLQQLLPIPLAQATLRPFRAKDAMVLSRIADSEDIARNLRDAFPHPYSLHDAERWLAVATAEERNWLLAIEVDGEIAGGIGLHFFEDVYRRGAELGYWLAPHYWGRGIASQAVTVLSQAAFAQTDLLRLQAGVFSFNTASMRVLEKAGFLLEAIRRCAVFKRGQIYDEHLYCRLRPDPTRPNPDAR